MSKSKNTLLLTYSTDDGHAITKSKVEARICWGEPTRDLEIVVDKQENQETAVYLPLKEIIKLIMAHIEEKK